MSYVHTIDFIFIVRLLNLNTDKDNTGGGLIKKSYRDLNLDKENDVICVKWTNIG